SIDKRRDNRGVYICSTYRNHEKARCTGYYMRYDKICQHVYDSIKALITKAMNYERKLLENILKFKRAEMELNTEGSGSESELKERLENIRKVFVQMYEDYALRKLPCDEYYRLKELYELEKQDIKTKLDEISNKSLKISKPNDNIRVFISILKSMKIDSELTKENVDLLIEKILITESKDKSKAKSICIYYKNVGIIHLC
ncbi:MAG: DUF4368 domain-containing protein, partial [Candidatus Izemoplasmatales bacterium]